MSETLRVIIADDERPARSLLASMLLEFDEVSLVGEASTGTEAVELIERERPDLALLDLQMPEIDGLGVVRLLKKDRMPAIAFVTAYDEYAVQAFELNAVDYLLKPIDRARLRRTIERASEKLEVSELRLVEAERVQAAARQYEKSTKSPYLERIPVQKAGEIIIVPIGQIASIVADAEHLNITTERNEQYTINYRLKVFLRPG